jgi:hypothetical protein
MNRKEVCLLVLNRAAALIRTRARTKAKGLVEGEEKSLLAALRAALHPLSLSHERHAQAIDLDNLGLLLDLDDLLFALLGEEDTRVRIDASVVSCILSLLVIVRVVVFVEIRVLVITRRIRMRSLR